MKRFSFFLKELLSTFWFVPVLIILFAIGLAMGVVYLDSRIRLPDKGFGNYLFISNPESARSILTTVSGAMIGVAGTVFSITLVVLTLASSQFGPRLIKNFMYVRLNQVVLGSYVSTYLYCLIVLNSIKYSDEVAFVPSLSILLALLAALANIILLIVFIHHIAISIQADKVISDLSGSLSDSIRKLFPEKVGSELDEYKEKDEESIKSAYREKNFLRARKRGYLQYIDINSLVKLGTKIDGLFELNVRAGDYLVEDAIVCRVYTHEPNEDEIIRLFNSRLIVGNSRTYQQDAEYSIHQMVEIAAKALSPGVNDPFTAIACIDNLSSVMAYLTGVKFPSKYRYDKDESLRVIADVVTYEGMMDAAFNQIRQYSNGNPSVVIRLMESLVVIYELASSELHREAIRNHAGMVLNMAGQTFKEPKDLKDLEERWEPLKTD